MTKTQVITKDNFWDADLENIESTFLKKGTSITDLPIYLNDAVPPQDIILPVEKTKEE